MDIVTTAEGWIFLLRYFHFLAGITWIGVLYYFNFIQTPFFGTELGGTARSAMIRGLVHDPVAQRSYLLRTSMLTSARESIARVQRELAAL